MKTLRILLALSLLLVLSLHTIHFDHDHPGHIFGEGIQAVFHGEDKKWFSVLPESLGVSLSSTLLFARMLLGVFVSYTFDDPIRLALARGRIQKRLYE